MAIFTPQWLRSAVIVAATCLGGQAAFAQAAPVQYWLPSGLFGMGGNWADANTATYRNFPGFDAGYVSDADWRANFRTGAFVRSETGSIGLNGLGLNSLGLNSFGPGTVSSFGALTTQSTVTGYAFKGAGDLPVTVYAGFDKLDYRPGLGSPLAPFSSDASIAAGYSARAGIAFQPAPNVRLSVEAGFTQQQLDSSSDINARLLPLGRR
ncbi:MAG: hypothetical protein ABW213_04260 [Tardiphaga sp.]